MNKKIKIILIAAAGCIGAGGILMGIGSALGGYSELGKINGARGWREYGRMITPLGYSVYSLPGLGNLLAGLDGIRLSEEQEAMVEDWADDFEDRVDNWADGVENSVDNWADGVEDSVDNWADGFYDSADKWADGFYDSVDNWAEGVEDSADNWADRVENRAEDWADGIESSAGQPSEDKTDNAGYYDGEETNVEQEVFSGDFETEIAFEKMPAALEIEIGVHGLKIEEGDAGEIRLAGRNADRIQCYVENGTLYVKDVGKHKKYKRTNGRELTLTVPVGTEWETAAVDADLGYVYAETLAAKTAVLDAEMGSIEAGSLKADFLEASSEMGNIELKEGTVKGLKASAEMGNILFSGTIEGPVEADSEMGNVTLRLCQRQEDFNYKVRSEMGEIRIGGEKYGAGDGREKTLDHGAGREMDLETSMGSIEILFESR